MAADSFCPPAGGAPGCAWRDGVPGWLRRAGEPGCVWRPGDPGGGPTFRLASARRVASCTRSISGLGIWGCTGVWVNYVLMHGLVCKAMHSLMIGTHVRMVLSSSAAASVAPCSILSNTANKPRPGSMPTTSQRPCIRQ